MGKKAIEKYWINVVPYTWNAGSEKSHENLQNQIVLAEFK